MNDAYTSIVIGIISRFPTILNLGFNGLVFASFADKFNINLKCPNTMTGIEFFVQKPGQLIIIFQ